MTCIEMPRAGDAAAQQAAAAGEADDDQAGLPRLNAVNALMQVTLSTFRDKEISNSSVCVT